MSNDGGGAFPQIETDREQGEISGAGDIGHVYSYGGMTLRDYFAAKAFQALITKSPFFINEARTGEQIEEHRLWAVVVGQSAYRFADAMLEARNVS